MSFTFLAARTPDALLDSARGEDHDVSVFSFLTDTVDALQPLEIVFEVVCR